MGKSKKAKHIITEPKKKSNKIIVSIDPLKCRKFSTDEIGRGVYVSKSGKGKGSYRRREKNAKNYI